ncbi:hypothetical protein WN51_08593 [Melipona quadrifasciata]|uniref:Uncharacterized protein n=1 Tax=Melipona quadrifasciata TaxID=166423 RepID=A0A0N0BJ92_9HYME|nr:hypothetical protein WN51_08593 [Melipona quadrifasciata]
MIKLSILLENDLTLSKGHKCNLELLPPPTPYPHSIDSEKTIKAKQKQKKEKRRKEEQGDKEGKILE